jgi:hypothetical protein
VAANCLAATAASDAGGARFTPWEGGGAWVAQLASTNTIFAIKIKDLLRICGSPAWSAVSAMLARFAEPQAPHN